MFGRSVKKEEMDKPIDHKNIWIGAYIRKELKLINLYGYGQTRPKRDSNLSPPKQIDVVVATMLVNQAAKRYRDMASTCYHSRLHGFAGTAKEKKEELYCLKDRGIVHCYNNALIKYEGMHGGFALYRSTDGVNSFHSKLIPESVEIDDNENDNPVRISAKPAKRGYRLKDAIFTIEALPSDKTGFKYLPSPSCYEDDDRDMSRRCIFGGLDDEEENEYEGEECDERMTG
jgi:hypothetical protein